MKNLFFLIAAFAITSLIVCGQTSEDVPAKVKTTFAKKFPNSTNVKWVKESDNEWEAEFKMEGKEYSANFDNTGTWMETEYKIGTNEIPATVKATIEKEFAGYKIEESELSETADDKVYEFELKNDKEEMEVVIDMNGNIVKKEYVKEDDEDDED